jgi:hypothetical protein
LRPTPRWTDEQGTLDPSYFRLLIKRARAIVGLGRAIGPEPSPSRPGIAFQTKEVLLIPVIRQIGRGLGVSAVDQLRVDETIADVHIGQQLPMTITRLRVKNQGHPLSLDELTIRLPSDLFIRFPAKGRMKDFGRVKS